MRSDVRKIAYISRRALALLLTLAMVLAIVPPIEVFAASQDSSSKQIVFDATQGNEYYHKPIVINETTMVGKYETNKDRYEILIKGSPFSVTVQELTNVVITFLDVEINRADDSGTITVDKDFIQASEDLGWYDRWYDYVPTCPFLITGNAAVEVTFNGNNVFKAGTNGWYCETQGSGSNVTYRLRRRSTNQVYLGGYAGIQVDSGSSLTILGGNVEAWGAFQAVSNYQDAIDMYPHMPGNNTPSGVVDKYTGGGAGIGGGTSYDHFSGCQASNHKYVQGTPGNITINGGNIVAVGGTQAAGIGGGVNGAATSGTITINGGVATSVENSTKVLAIGGFWSAGIGDGDSVQGKESETYIAPYSIVINGGEVKAYGGTGSAGIGTTDEITSKYQNNISGMSVHLNGGDVTALSGYTQGGKENAAAAIGAGENTDMKPYSITIAEGTIVKASSFSKYAISHAGTNAATIPQTVVDPNTYMYLAYYGDDVVSESENRKFTLHQIKRTELGDHMLANAVADVVLAENGVTANPSNYVFFGYEEATQNYYLVDENGKVIADEQCAKYYLVRDADTGEYSAVGEDVSGQSVALDNDVINSKLDAMKDGDPLSYYFIKHPPLKTFEVPAQYKAVAMTLYAPEVFGGKYILHVPGTSEGNVYAVIEKESSGESSGQILAKTDPHFELANPGPVKPGNSAVTPDAISKELTDLIVETSDGRHLGLTGADQTFAPGTKSYNVWLPVGSTEYTVSAFWDTSVSCKVQYRVGDGDWGNGTNSGDTMSYSISAGQTKEIWIQKSDTNITNSVIYKLTVRVKSKYYLTPTDKSKTYDGIPITQGVDYMLTTSGAYDTSNDVTSLLTGETVTYTYVQTHDAAGNDIDDIELYTMPKNAGKYKVTAEVNATEFQAEGTREIVISKRPITLIGVENWRYYLNNKSPDTIELTTNPNDTTKFYAGAIRMDGVIQDTYGDYEMVNLNISKMQFVNRDVGPLDDKKILIEATIASDLASANYTFVGYTHSEYEKGNDDDGDGIYQFLVPGQITYEVDGAMFLYGDLVNTTPNPADFLWYKYYPVLNNPNDPEQLSKYLVFKDEDGESGWDDPVDYHSPDSQTHAEHIYVRAVNKGKDEARYAVDITFGNMIFQYTKTIWNVNELEYEMVTGASDVKSIWMDPPSTQETVHGIEMMQNYILIENRSNRDIAIRATADINWHSKMSNYSSDLEFNDGALNEKHGVTARLTWGQTVAALKTPNPNNSVNTGSGGVATTDDIMVSKATVRTLVNDGMSDSEIRDKAGYMLIAVKLLGIPSTTKTVGQITVTVLPTS